MCENLRAGWLRRCVKGSVLDGDRKSWEQEGLDSHRQILSSDKVKRKPGRHVTSEETLLLCLNSDSSVDIDLRPGTALSCLLYLTPRE